MHCLIWFLTHVIFYRKDIDYFCVMHVTGKGLFSQSKGRPKSDSRQKLKCSEVLNEKILQLRNDFSLHDDFYTNANITSLTGGPDSSFTAIAGQSLSSTGTTASTYYLDMSSCPWAGQAISINFTVDCTDVMDFDDMTEYGFPQNN